MRAIIITLIATWLILSSTNAQNKAQALTFDYIKTSLKKEMNYKTVIETFGVPDKDIGSGIYIFVYEFPDSARMIISCIDKVSSAIYFNYKEDFFYNFFENLDSISDAGQKDKMIIDSLNLKY